MSLHPEALARYQEAVELQAKGNLRGARDLYLRALELDARLDDARLALAGVLRELGDRDGATLQLRDLVARSPQNLEAILRLGMTLSEQNRLGEAVAMLRRAVELDPAREEALRELVRLTRQQQDLAGEAHALQLLCELYPAEADLNRTLADRCLGLGKADVAVAALRRTLAVAPDDLPARLLLADAEGRLGHGEQAWQILQGVAADHAEAPGLQDAVANLCRQQALEAGMIPDQWPLAITWWERLISVLPDDAQALERLEKLYELQERWDDLARLVELTYRRNLYHPPLALKLAQALERASRPLEAFNVLKAALVAHPQDGGMRQKAMELAIVLELTDEAEALISGRRERGVLPPAERLHLARAKAIGGQREEAWALIEDVLGDREHGAAARELGLEFTIPHAESLEHNPVQALVWWERALRCNPQHEHAARTAAILYRQINRGHDAVRVLRALPERYKKPDLLREFAAACDAAALFDEGHEAYFALAAREGYTAEGVAHLIELSLGALKLARAWEECELLARVAPDYPKLRAVQAKVSASIAADLEKQGKFDEAIEWLKRHLGFEPDSPERKRLAAAHLAVGDVNGAVLQYRAWFRRHPTDIETALWLGKNELADGLYSEAREYFEAVLDLRPNNLDALEGLATAATGEGNDDEAFTLFQRLRALRRDHLPSSLQLAELAWKKGEPQAAWEMVEGVLKQNPTHEPAVKFAEGLLRWMAANAPAEESERWSRRLVELAPDDLEARKALALNTAARPDASPAEVVEAFAPVLEAEPEDPDAQLAQLRAAFEAGDLLAVRYGLSQPELASRPEGLWLGAELDLNADRPAEAEALLREALAQRPGEPRYGLALADALARREAWSECWDQLQALGDELSHSPRAIDLRNRAVWKLAESASPEEAVELLASYAREAREDVETRLNLAERCVALERPEAAIGWLEEILASDPHHEKALFRLAALQAQRGQLEAALELLAPLRDQANVEAIAVAARLLLASGQRTRARSEYENLVARSPSNKEGHLALARFAAEEANGPLAWRLLREILLSHPEDAELRREAIGLLIELAERLHPENALEWWPAVVSQLSERFEVQAMWARLLKAVGDPRGAVRVLEPLLARMPHETELLTLLADSLVAAGEPERARKLYGIAAQAGDPGAARVLGELSFREGDFSRSASWFARAVVMLPDEPGLRLELARARLEGQDAPGALVALQDLLAIWPEHPVALELLPKALHAVGSAIGTETALAYWRELALRPGADADVLHNWLAAARAVDDKADVLSALEKLVVALPQDGALSAELAEARLEAGQVQSARAAIDRALALGEERALRVGAKLALAQGHPRAAASWLARFQEHHPSDPAGLRLQAAIAAATRDPEGEWAAWAKLCEGGLTDPERERALELVRTQLAKAGRSALRWAQRGLELEPEPGEIPAPAVCALGLALLKNRDVAGGHRALEWAAAAGEPAAWLALARLARHEGDRPQALAAYDRALELKPLDSQAAYERAVVLGEEGQTEAACRQLEALVAREPEHQKARALLGKGYQRLAKEAEPEQALDWLEAWVLADPSSIPAWRALAQLAKTLGRTERAEQAAEQIVVLDADDHDGAMMLGLSWLMAGKAAQAAPLLVRAANSGLIEARKSAIQACVAGGDYENAHAQLIAWRSENPDAIDQEIERARLATGLARRDPDTAWQALEALEASLAAYEAPTIRMLRMGRCWEGFEADTEVGKWLGRASALNPAEEDLPGIAHYEIGTRLLDQGQPEAGRTAMLSAAGRGYPPAALALARAERAEGRVEEALRWYRAARELQSLEPDLLREHASLLISTGRDREAFEVLSDLLTTTPDAQAEQSQVAILRRLAEEAPADESWLANLGPRAREAAWALILEAEDQHRWAEIHAWAGRLEALGDPQARSKAWQAAMQAGSSETVPTERIRWYKRAVELRPEDSATLRTLIRALEREGLTNEALRYSERLIALEPKSLEAARLNTENLLATGRLAEARQVLAQAAEHAHDPELRVLAARLLAAEGDLDQAQAMLASVLAEVPHQPEARLAQADLAWGRGEYRQALAGLEAAIQLTPSDRLKDGAARRMIELAERMADSAGAASQEVGELCRRALGHRPDFPAGLALLADHLVAAGRAVEALPHLYNLVRLEPIPDHLLRLANALLGARRTPEAVAILGSLAEETDYPPAWHRLAELELELDHPEEALVLAERLVERQWPGADELARQAAKVVARRKEPAEDPEGAWQAWQKVLLHAPDDPDALVGLARASAMRGDVEEAIGLLETLLGLREDWMDAKSLLGECYLLLGQSEQAERLFHEVLAADPDHAPTLLALARAAQTRGEFVSAGDYAQRVMALADPADREKARRLAAYCARQLAEAARLRRDFDQAFLWAELVVAYQSSTFDVMRFNAELARDAGRMGLAASRYRRLLIAFPSSLEEALQLARCLGDAAPDELEYFWHEHRAPAVAHALATLHGDAGHQDQALEWWRQALEVAPRHPILLRRLADLCRREGYLAESCRYYQRLVDEQGTDPLLLRTWGATALKGDLFAEAIAPYERLATDHQDSEALVTLAMIHLKLDDPHEAWSWAHRAVEAGQDGEAISLAAEAAHQLAVTAEEPEQAIGWWRHYLELRPEDLEGWLALGHAQELALRLEEAQETYLHSRELAPAEVEPGFALAELHRRQGHLEEARQAYREVVREHPQHVPSLFALAELAWDRGEREQVWELGQRLLALNHKDPRAAELIGRCAKQLADEATQAQDWETAIQNYEQLLAFCPDERLALGPLCEAYVHAGHLAEAVTLMRERVALDPEDDALRFRHGEIAAMGGFWEEAREVFLALRERTPEVLAVHQALAIVALGLADAPAAAAHYQDALAIAPDDLTSLFGLGRIRLAEGDLHGAWPALRRAVELSGDDPDHADYVAMARTAAEGLAEQADDKHLWDEAIAFRHEVVRLDPADAEARRLLARTCYDAGRKAEAISELTTLLAGMPGDLDSAFLLGEIHRQSGELEGARRIYQQIIGQAPRHFEARMRLAQIAWESSELEPSWTHLQEALKARPKDDQAQALQRKLSLAFAERAQTQGDLAGAIRWWELAASQEGVDLDLLKTLAQAQVEAGLLDGAAETYGRILDADPKDLETAHVLADLHRRRGDLRSAEGPLLRIVALDPRHLPSLRALMLLAHERQHAGETLKRAYDVLDVEPDNVEALMQLAWAHEQMMERRAAMECCKEVVQIDPQHAEAFHTMARLARDLGDRDLAKKAITSAIYFQPRAAYYHTMGTIYQAFGQTEEALASFGQALTLDPENADAHADLGLGLLRQSKAEKARPHLQRAFALFPPDSPRAIELQCALDLIG